MSVNCYFLMVLICIPLMTKDADHLFMYLSAIFISLEKCLLKSFVQFELGCLSFCYWVPIVLYVFQIVNLYEIHDLQICSSLLWVILHSLVSILWCTQKNFLLSTEGWLHSVKFFLSIFNSLILCVHVLASTHAILDFALWK